MRERKTIIDIRLNQKTIVVDYSATCLTVATQQTFTFYNCKYVNSATYATVFQLTTVRANIARRRDCQSNSHILIGGRFLKNFVKS